MTEYRREAAYKARVAAATKAREREHPLHRANGDEQRYASANYAMSFTKGLTHSTATGLIERKEDFEDFRRAIDVGQIADFTTRVRSARTKGRQWEAPTAGVTFDLEGPDPQAVTMPPAPSLGSDELAYEMAEVYELALLRDLPFTAFAAGGGNAGDGLDQSIERLNGLPYSMNDFKGRPRKSAAEGGVDRQTAFRGSSPQVEVGPYLSQFLLIGNAQPTNGGVAHGFIQYGAQQINQRVTAAPPGQDYMTEWGEYIRAQNGEELRDDGALFGGSPNRRFIVTPRDMATYVHDDALYQAYLNACLILLSMNAPFDPAFNLLSGKRGEFFFNTLDNENLSNEEIARQVETQRFAAGGFALFGGPHILTLVTEVATRALKAVRYQKFNNHIRLRPEALAARIHRAGEIGGTFKQVGTLFADLKTQLTDTIEAIKASTSDQTYLLPMAFQEGSPMHPSYGAGHATVAGACVTILKAYFDTNAVFVRGDRDGTMVEVFDHYRPNDLALSYTPNNSGTALDESASTEGPFLTLEGELNKLAANISIGRNMAGVHYFSDYYDSLRMGEQIAIGVLEEQALCYPEDPFILTVPTFDGDVVRIGKR